MYSIQVSAWKASGLGILPGASWAADYWSGRRILIYFRGYYSAACDWLYINLCVNLCVKAHIQMIRVTSSSSKKTSSFGLIPYGHVICMQSNQYFLLGNICAILYIAHILKVQLLFRLCSFCLHFKVLTKNRQEHSLFCFLWHETETLRI